jgi:hypothetical protein
MSNRTMSNRTVSVWKRLAGSGALASVVWLAGVNSALAAPKKKVEPVAAPTKSYTVPYMLVLAFLGIGLMTVCRPSGRLEKVDDKLKETKES